MCDYSQAKIYKLVSKDTNEIYIGSTCNPLNQRLSEHISNYRRFLVGKMAFISSYHLVNCDDIEICLIENFPCQTNTELHRREGFYIRNTVCVNIRIAGRNIKEYPHEMKDYYINYYQDNKAELNAKHAKYNLKNRARIHARQNAKFLCDCGGKYTRANRARHIRSLQHQSFISKQEE